MRRTTPVWLLTIVLAVATGAVLSGTVAVVTAPLPNAPSLDRSSAVVWAFYDAVNHVLQTGETASLDALLADDMVEHAPAPGLPPSASSLIRRLLGLHATHPGMTLVVEEVLASGDFATARVHVEGSEPGVFLGLPVGEDRATWGPLDQFRVVDGRIVAHWGSAAPSTLLELLQHASVANWFPPGEFVALERLTVPVRSQPAPLNAAGVRLIYLGVGSLTVSIDPKSAGPGLRSAAAGSAPAGPPEPIAPGEQGILGPGELLALPMATGHEIVNTASVTVEAVVMTSRSSDRPSDVTRRLDPAASLIAQAAHDAAMAEATSPVSPNSIELSSVLATVALGCATIAPGGALQLSEATGLVVVAVESGTLDLHVAGSTAWLRHGGTGPTSAVRGSSLAAGDDVLVWPSSAISFRNLGTTPTALLLATILPEESPT